jgi:hypothetical protein
MAPEDASAANRPAAALFFSGQAGFSIDVVPGGRVTDSVRVHPRTMASDDGHAPEIHTRRFDESQDAD